MSSPSASPVMVPITGAHDALMTVAAMAARLARRDALEDRIADVLQRLQAALGATGCALWTLTPAGLHRFSLVGRVDASPAEVQALVDQPGADATPLVARAVVAGDRRMAVLAASLEHALTAEERLLLQITADMLGPKLYHAERARQLELEIEARTRQNDEQRRFTEKIIDSLPVGLYVIDREYRINAWNRKRETGMQGVAREEAIGRTIFEILHRQPAETLRREFDEVLRTGKIQVFHMDSKASGDLRTYRISKIPMRLTDGGVTHVITIGEDVTEWKEAQERFAQAEKLAAIGQLAAGVMHEVNNPLATIAACAESLELRLADLAETGVTVPSGTGDLLKIVDQEVHRCKRIVDNLLDFSRPKPVVKASTSVNDVIEQTIFLVKHHSRFKKLRMDTELDAGIDRVHANQEQLVQVFMALLINAVDAMEEKGGGTITIRTRRGRDARTGVIAEVTDQGDGVPRGDASKIFEPFYTTKAPGRGTGLGLSIVYGIITDHKGRIEVDSEPGAGSTFRILLPSESAA